MGACVQKLPHHTDKCNSSDALQVFEQEDGKLDGYCFNCGTYVENPYGEPKTIKDIPKSERLTKSKEELLAEIQEISECQAMDLPERRLRRDSLDHFRTKVIFSQQDGKTPIAVAFPYYNKGHLVRYKCRRLDKKIMWGVSIDKDVELFGWPQAIESGAKRLIITEGEFDAIAMHRILELYTPEQYKDYKPAVVSVPNGAAGAAKDIAKYAADIRRHFKEVSLCFDNDDAGKKATEEVLKILPAATVITLPCKDANECLMEGKGKEAHKSITFNAVVAKNSRIIKGSELRDLARVRPEMGLSWPWPGLTKLTRGIRRGETIYIGAGVKMGKSVVVDEIGWHLIGHHGLPVFFCKPEEDKARTYQNLVGKAASKIFHDPDIPFDEEAFDKYEPLIGDKAIIIDNYQFVNWDSLKDDIRYAVKNEDCHDIILDPVTCFTAGMSASETNEFLVGWAAELAAMAKDLEFTSYIFCHLKAPDNGPTHERGGQVLSTQFTGSRAMMRSCHTMIGLEGNKDPELSIEERNTRKLKVLEDRNFGSTGVIKLYYDYKTGRLNEMRV